MADQSRTVDGESSLGRDGTAHSCKKDHSSGPTVDDFGRLAENWSKPIGFSNCPPEQGKTENWHEHNFGHEEIS